MATGLFTSIHDWQNEYTAHLSSDITNVSTDINLDSVPTPTEGCLVIDPDTPANTEIIFYTSKTSSKVTVPSVANGRGYDGTTAIAHLSGTKVIMAPIADDFRYVRTQVTNAQAGWTQLTTATLTFTSYDSTNKTGVIGTSIDLTGTISVGMKLRFTNNSSTQYCFVTATSASTVTVYFGTDYSLTNSAITVPYYSVQKSPFGFPLDPAKWSQTLLDTSSTPGLTQGAAVTGANLSGPIGVWRAEYAMGWTAVANASSSSRAMVTLSTTGSTNTNPETNSGINVTFTTGTTGNTTNLCARGNTTFAFASVTTVYVYCIISTGTITVNQTYGPIYIKLTSAYL